MDWIEETLRYDTSSQMLLRVTRTPIELHGTTIPEGERVLLLVGSANRDESVFPDADRYDLDRDTSRLVSFGSGRHFCMGAPLARLEARVALGELVRAGRHLRRGTDRDRAGPLHQRAGPGRAPDHRDAPLMPRFEPNPERRPAVVTGASSGIGQATARALAGQGHPVALGARRVAECEDTAAAIRADGGEAVAIHLDLADADSVEQFAKAAVDALGEVEIVVSNAAQNIAGAVLETSSEAFDGVMSVNLSGTHRLIRALVPAMTERRRGDIVFVTSDVAERPRPSMAAYVTSKWGLEGYVELAPDGARGDRRPGHHRAPGPTLTGMGMDWDPAITGEVIRQWEAWGFARHSNFMRPSGVAQAIVAVVGLPRGTHATLIELQPEAPIRTQPNDEGEP